MNKLRLTRAATRDLQQIRAAGVAEHGTDASDVYVAGFDRLFQLLREYPYTGQQRTEFTDGLRSLSHRPYRILYRAGKDVVIVSRIIHQARDLPAALRSRR